MINVVLQTGFAIKPLQGHLDSLVPFLASQRGDVSASMKG